MTTKRTSLEHATATLVTPGFLERLSDRVPYVDGKPDFASVEWGDYSNAMNTIAETPAAKPRKGPNPLVVKLLALARTH
jgi:hypothetical protein